MTPMPRPRGRGFALVLVLWVLAGLTVVAVAVASSMRVSSESVKLLRERVAAEAAYLSTAARVQVIAATGASRESYREGLRGRLYVDGRSTEADPGEWVAVQDSRGLVNLDTRDSRRLIALLQRCGASDAQAPVLADTLADYIDGDNLKRLNGAEAFDYRAADLPPPRNAALLSRDELWRVKGWAALREAWQAAGCDAMVSVRSDGRFNRNTAPRRVLEADGMTPDAAAAVVEARRDGLPSLLLGTGAADGANFMSLVFAGPTMRIEHRLASVEWVMAYELELTPTRNGGPWRLHELRYRPRPAELPRTQAVLPAPDYEVPERERPPKNAASRLPFDN